MANRAVDAYKRHCGQVLILTFNITLKNLIRDRISDVLNHRDDNHFAITNYHQFYNSQLNECGIDINTLIGKYGLVDLYQHDVFRNETVSKYKTILIDEVQDFESEWVKITRDNFLEPDGEMVLFGDQSQNIYERDDGRAAVIAKGFGDWKTLTRSYRISSDSPMNYLIKSFQTQFLINKHSDADIIEVTANQIAMNFDLIKYHSYDTNDWEEKCFSEIQSYIKGYNLNPNDIVILSSRKYLLRKVSERFNKIEKTHCMFDTYSELYELLRIHDKELSLEGLKCLSEKELYERYIREYNLKTEINDMCRIKKNHFYANSGLIKLSTTHSFKGLESKTVFYILDDKDTPEVIYTSITRAIENIIILDISVEKKYKEFFCGYVI
nr:UvrD-helicase domain-containing protein [Klebsiella grimontii]